MKLKYCVSISEKDYEINTTIKTEQPMLKNSFKIYFTNQLKIKL